ncbi:hypothetical protein RIF29_06428 [Crotalaria pallida]|uniref:RING-type E3 ubiquitin transferase n=1 Tax=Crotalaria pallida TaxID=3830 RepID=A0AAN9J362_CROPI
MDEYFCSVYPVDTVSSEKPRDDDDQKQYFNVEIKCTHSLVLNARKFETHDKLKFHNFENISKEDMMQEKTILGFLSSIGVPNDAHNIMVAKILACASHMLSFTHKNQSVLSMHVDITITKANEELSSDDDTGDDDDDVMDEYSLEDDDEGGLGLEPASKSCIEELETFRVKEEQEEEEEEQEEEGGGGGSTACERKCAICYEDIDEGVKMPCLHNFHRNCIVDWLNVASSCPLCRFKMPTTNNQKW